MKPLFYAQTWRYFLDFSNNAFCDIMPSGCPSDDPDNDNDTEITADRDPDDYFVNKALHDMVELTV